MLKLTHINFFSQNSQKNVRLGPRKLGDFKEIPDMLGFDSEYPTDHAKANF